MKITAIVSFLLFLGGQAKKSFWKSKELNKERPHIVFILADDVGWNEVFSQTFVIFASIITIIHMLPCSQMIRGI